MFFEPKINCKAIHKTVPTISHITGRIINLRKRSIVRKKFLAIISIMVARNKYFPIVTLTKIVTPFLASRKCDYYEL